MAELGRSHEVVHYGFRRMYPPGVFPGSVDPAPGPPPPAASVATSRCTLDGLSPRSWWRTADEIRTLRPDLVLLQWWTPWWLPLTVVLAAGARRAGIPVGLLVHQAVEPDSGPAHECWTRIAMRWVAGAVALNGATADRLRRMRPSIPVVEAVMPVLEHHPRQGLDSGAARASLGLEREARWLLAFGFVRRYKGLEVLLEALGRVPQAHLVVAGEFWDDVRRYHRLARRWGVSDRVRFHDGYVPNDRVESYFVAADAVVLPYLAGGHSAVATLARSFGRPVVVSDVGDLAHRLAPGDRVVPPGDVAALAEALATVGPATARPVAASTGWCSVRSAVTALAAELGADCEMPPSCRTTAGDEAVVSAPVPGGVTAILPVYNEAVTVREVVHRVAALDCVRQVVAVDDGSTDAGADQLRELAADGVVELIRLPYRRGKGAAVRAGLDRARQPWIVIQDADLEYPPEAIPGLLQKARSGVDLVVGDRFSAAGPEGMAPGHRLVNRIVTALFNRWFGGDLADVLCGHKLIRRLLVEDLGLTGDGFELDVELLARARACGASSAQVPVPYSGRRRRDGKKIRLVDSLRIMRTMWRLRPGRDDEGSRDGFDVPGRRVRRGEAPAGPIGS